MDINHVKIFFSFNKKIKDLKAIDDAHLRDLNRGSRFDLIVPFHNSAELALPALSKNLQLQFLSSARWAVCNWGPCVPSQIPWLWECARLLEKVMIFFFSLPHPNLIFTYVS